MDAIQMLTDDHKQLMRLFEQIMNKEGDMGEVVADIEKTLKIHAMLEEEIFYGTFKELAQTEEDRSLYFESLEEHHVVDMLLPELKLMLNKEGDRFIAKATVAKELLSHHAKEEEEEMFPRAKELFASRMSEVSQRMTERRQELLDQWEGPVTGALRKAQSVSDKFMTSRVKDLRAERGAKEDEKRDERR